MNDESSIPKFTPEAPVEQLSFEQAFTELNSIVEALESGQHTLDEAVQLYERGQELARRCASLLDQAELKLQTLAGKQLDEFLPPT